MALYRVWRGGAAGFRDPALVGKSKRQSFKPMCMTSWMARAHRGDHLSIQRLILRTGGYGFRAVLFCRWWTRPIFRELLRQAETYIESVIVDRKEFAATKGLKLSPHPRDLQIDYTSPTFTIPQKVRFRYRLDGLDRDWKDAGTRRQAFYSDLPPGKYSFRDLPPTATACGMTPLQDWISPSGPRTTRQTGFAPFAWSYLWRCYG